MKSYRDFLNDRGVAAGPWVTVVSDAEEWRAVPGYLGLYEVSSLGRARSFHRGGKMLSTSGSDESGYPVISLTKNGKRHTFTLHRLVCRAFHGEPDGPGLEVAHLDGNQLNCRADNLKWVTKIENEAHKRLHGTRAEGEKASGAKITEAQARTVKLLSLNGASIREAAEGAGVSYHTARDIIRNRNWKHVSAECEARQSGGASRNALELPL